MPTSVTASNKVFPMAEIEAVDFAELIDSIAPYQIGIIRGCGVAKAVEVGSVWIYGGQVLIRGRVITVREGGLVLPPPSSGQVSYYILVVCNLSASSVEDSAEIVAAGSLSEFDPPTSETFNVNNERTYAILATATRTPTEVSTVSVVQRAPSIANAGKVIMNNLAHHGNRIAELDTSIAANTRSINSLKTTLGNQGFVSNIHAVSGSASIDSLAAGAIITVTIYPESGATAYPETNAQNKAHNDSLEREARNRYESQVAQGTLEGLMGIVGLNVGHISGGSNGGNLVIRGWDCITGSSAHPYQCVTVSIKNVGSAAATNLSVEVKALKVATTKIRT